MKKSTKIVLHAITGIIVSAISFIGFKKGIQAVNCKMEKDQENESDTPESETDVKIQVQNEND